LSIKINDPAFDYDFQNLPFLANYNHKIKPESGGRMPVMNLQNKPAPAFELASFQGERVSSDSFKDKVVLIDLWEIWCGPCIASMPKVESLYRKYRDQGLLVFGITNDPKALSAAKAMVQKKAIIFPMLIGNEQFKKNYALQNISLPMYLLIDKTGMVKGIFPGFTDEIEKEIKSALL
jgi:thiol-disulfide isomerase/thioredoxin